MSRPERASQLEIRLAVPGDEAVIAELISAAFGPFRDQYTPDAFEYTAATAERIRERFDEGPMWLVFDGENAVGTVSGLPEPDRFYVRSMAVRPEGQGKGVGQLLLNTLEGYARETGYEVVYLYTTFVLPGARPLYEKNGYYVTRETPPEEWFGMGGIEMEKSIVNK